MVLVQKEIVVTGAEVGGAERAYPLSLQLGQVALTTLALTLALFLLPLFAIVFWFLAELIRQALHRPTPVPALWPLLAGTLAAWSLVFLAHDRIGAVGNARAERLTRERTTLLLGAEPTAPAHFVELRLKGYPPDIGWLYVESDQLRFVGDVIHVRLPRSILVGEALRTSPTLGGVLSAYVEIGPLRLLPREGIERLSDARRLAPVLADRLRLWLDADREP
jgi:hypothetical protein